MISAQTKQAFERSEKGITLRELLEEMVKSPFYNTHVYGFSDSKNGSAFVDKHMNYMCGFPKMDHLQYVSNLRLMTKVVASKSAVL